MRRWGRRIAYGLVGIAVAIAVLYVAVPPAKTEADGPADPILWIRRPVVKGLHHVGILPRAFFGPDDWIPTAGDSESWSGEGKAFETADAATRVTWESRPVYRGLLWRTGMRFTVKVDRRGDPKGDPARLRLWLKPAGGEKTMVAEGGPGVSEEGTGLRRWRVDGYIPGDAVAFGYDSLEPDGTVAEGSSWSED